MKFHRAADVITLIFVLGAVALVFLWSDHEMPTSAGDGGDQISAVEPDVEPSGPQSVGDGADQLRAVEPSVDHKERLDDGDNSEEKVSSDTATIDGDGNDQTSWVSLDPNARSHMDDLDSERVTVKAISERSVDSSQFPCFNFGAEAYCLTHRADVEAVRALMEGANQCLDILGHVYCEWVGLSAKENELPLCVRISWRNYCQTGTRTFEAASEVQNRLKLASMGDCAANSGCAWEYFWMRSRPEYQADDDPVKRLDLLPSVEFELKSNPPVDMAVKLKKIGLPKIKIRILPKRIPLPVPSLPSEKNKKKPNPGINGDGEDQPPGVPPAENN